MKSQTRVTRSNPIDLTELVCAIRALLQDDKDTFFTTAFAKQSGRAYLELLTDSNYMNDKAVWDALQSMPCTNLPCTPTLSASRVYADPANICVEVALDADTASVALSQCRELEAAPPNFNTTGLALFGWNPFRRRKDEDATSVVRRIWSM